MTGMAVWLGRLEVETPDHVVLRYDLAGGGNRGFAALLDAVAAAAIASSLGVFWDAVGADFARPLTGAWVLLIALLLWSYFVLLEWLWNGQTLGKRIFGLRVISGDGSPARFVPVLVRNLVRIVDFLPAFYGLGLLAIILSSRSQRLGDLAAGTFVVRAPRPKLDWLSLRTFVGGTAGAGGAGAGRTVVPGPGVDVRLSGEAQRLVREFVAREARLLPEERRRLAATIAAHLRTRVHEAAEDDDVELIRSVARALRASGER